MITPRRALGVCYGLWLCGVQINELLGTVGAWSTFLMVLIIRRDWLRRPSQARIERFWWPLIAFAAWSMFVPLVAGQLPTGTGLARLADWLLLPAAAVAFSELREHEPAWLSRALIAASAVLLLGCALAATQYFGLWPRSSELEAYRWLRLPFERMDETVPGRDDRFMAGGFLFHRLKFAHTSAVLVVTAAVALIRPVPRRWWYLVVLAAALPSILIFPHARAATAALVVGCVVMLVAGSRSFGRALVSGLFVAALGVAIVVAVPSVAERFSQATTNEGTSERQVMVRAGLETVEAHPLAGVGLGRFTSAAYAPDDAPMAVKENVGKAHNQLVSLAAEAGVPAALCLVIFLGWLVVIGWRARPEGAPLLAVLASALALFAVHDPLIHATTSMALMASLGATLSVARQQPRAARLAQS